MRIALMIDSLTVGGAEKLQVTFAREVRRRNHQLTVIDLAPEEDTAISDELRALGVNVVELPGRKLLDPVRLIRLVNLFSLAQFDVIHTHLSYANILGGLAGYLTRIAVVATIHLEANSASRPPLFHALEAFMIRSCVQHVVAVGERVAQVHQKRFPNVPTTVIINAVDLVPPLSPEERTAVRQEIVGDPTRPLLIGVGRLVAQKAWGDLIDAFARLRTTHPSAILVIVGQGECSDEIQERITAHGLEGHVRLLGLRGDVPRLLAASDLYVSSSHLEGLSVALLEAMSAGLPVVVTGVGDAPKVVSDERGILVPPAQTEQLAEAMAAMLSYPERMRRCGKAAQRYVVERHSPMVWIDQLFTVYARAQGALSHLEPASDNA